MAEGIAVKEPGAAHAPIVTALVKDILLVDESADRAGDRGAAGDREDRGRRRGAAAYAAVVANREMFAGRKVGIVLSGGNIDMRLLSNVILRELSREGRILSLEVRSRTGRDCSAQSPALWARPAGTFSKSATTA